MGDPGQKKQGHTQSPMLSLPIFRQTAGWEPLLRNWRARRFVSFTRTTKHWPMPGGVKLVQLRHLQDGWNGYAAPAPSERAIDTANSFIDILVRAKYEPKRLAPSAVGGVAVTQRSGNRKVY